MDVLLAHQRAVEAHSKYIRSSFPSLDPRLLAALEHQLAPDRLAPPPWLRVEPSFEPAGTAASLAAQGALHADLDALLQGRPMHRHELEAARRAAAGQDVVCAVEPSLAPAEPGLAAILNALLGDPGPRGPRALIVCATPRSLQAHADELYRCARNHQAARGGRFPLELACLDGQARLQGDADLLLATPAALDRLLLGEGGSALRERLLAQLRCLLVPALHGWRGRAGADAALLLRRLQAQCARRLTCIATCTPWAPDAPAGQRQADLAQAAATLLGRPFTAAQVVLESFTRMTVPAGGAPAAAALHEAAAAGVPGGDHRDELLSSPLAHWLERHLALRCAGNRLERGPARPWAGVAQQLAADAHVDAATAARALRGLLQWIGRVNNAAPAGPSPLPALPFRLHQALPYPGPVHATLDQDGRRVATLQPAQATDDGRPLFPMAFSRTGTGHGFYCVSRVGDRLLPRAFNAAGEGEDGYLLPGEHAWHAGAAAAFLPAPWLQRDRSGPHPQVQRGFPQRLSFDALGRCGNTTALPWQGWFMAAPLLFDPAARTAFNPAMPEDDKLLAGLPPAPRPAATAACGALVLSECHGDGCDVPGAEPARAPRMDLLAPDGLHAHLRALALSALDIPWMAGPVTALVDESRRDLPLRNEVRAGLRLNAAARASVHAGAHRALPALPPAPGDSLDALADRLDEALNAWRTLYRAARADLERATQALQGGLLRRDGAAWRRHERHRDQAQRLLGLLRGEGDDGLDALRLLAEQGFIPAHHHPRRPLRLFVPTPDGQGGLLRAPRAQALRDFGPLQRLCHQGVDYRVRRTLAAHTAAALTRARLARPSGGWLAGEQALDELCPLTGAALPQADWERLGDLLALGDGVAEVADAVSLGEAQAARGLHISTALALPDAAAAARDPRATLSADGQALLHLRHLQSARIVQFARHWHGAPEAGFPLDLTGGQWLAELPAPSSSPPQAQAAGLRRHPRRRVTPWTAYPADALLLTPAQALGLDRDALAAMARLLPRAAEQHFGLHPGELDGVLLGEGPRPALLLHEAGEGGLDVLRVLLASPQALPDVMAQAHRLRHHEAAPALHTALLRLAAASLELFLSTPRDDYDARYAQLLRQLPPQATAARRLLNFLHAQGLRLPDAVRRTVQGLYVQPDFYFEPRCWVFCIDPLSLSEGEAGREALLDRGDEVWTWAADEDLSACVARRPDLFRRER